MKRSNWFLAISLLGACATDPVTPPYVPPTTSVSGIVETDSAAANATVYLDLDDNNQLDAYEPQTTADATGHYTLTWNPDVVPQPHTIGAIVAPATGLAIHMRAPAGSTVISPLTTLVVSEMAQDPTLTQSTAAAKIAASLSASQSQFSAPVDVMADYLASTSPDNLQLRYTAGAVAAIIANAVASGNAAQSHIDCNDSMFFNPAIVAMDKQLTSIAAGTFKFSQLPAAAQADIKANPGNYMDYFIDTAALADDIEAELEAAALDLAAALFDEIKDEFVMQLEDAIVEAVVDELIGEILGA